METIGQVINNWRSPAERTSNGTLTSPEPVTERRPWTCQACGTSYNGVTVNVPGRGEHRIPPPAEGDCAECKRLDRDKFLAEQQRRDDQRVAARFMRWSQIGLEYQRCSFDNFEERSGTSQALAAAKAYVERLGDRDGRWLLLCGGPGTGKTHLGMAVRNAVEAKHGGLCIAATLPYLLQQIRESWGRNPRDPGDDTWSEGTILDKLQVAKLVLLDDLMAFPTWAYDRLFVLLDGRYRTRKSMVFTSNLLPKQLEEQLGDRLWSRIVARTQMVGVTADDYRKTVEKDRR